MLDFDFEANTWNSRASSIGQEKQFDSQSAVKQAVPCAVNGGENRLALRSYMLTCLNQHSAAVAKWYKAFLLLRIAATSIQVYVTWLVRAWAFLLTYPEADLTYF